MRQWEVCKPFHACSIKESLSMTVYNAKDCQHPEKIKAENTFPSAYDKS